MKATFAFVKECYRVLRPNGVLRITNEDIGAFARAYLHDPESVDLLNERNRKNGYKNTSYPVDIFNKYFFEDSIVCAYDAMTIQRFISEAGFKNVQNFPFGISSHAILNGIEQHDVGSIQNKFTFSIEGTKINAPPE
jgi:predicted SAM-dependent methyltransferase